MSVKFLSGSEAAAWGAKLARVEVISAYPISPNTGVIAALADMVDEGLLKASMVSVEGEHSAGSICAGAESAGSRAFTVTCGQGMAYMHEVLWMASGMALPILVLATNRGVGAPQTLGADFSDTLSERDSSFLQLFAQDAQEALDLILIGYRVGEHPDVLLPSFVSVEGYRLTHTYEPVDVPEPEDADRFLPPYKPIHPPFDMDDPAGLGNASLRHYYYMKYQQHRAMTRARAVLREAFDDFERIFGRRYDMIQPYRTGDAELILVGIGTMIPLIRELVDEYRESGLKVGAVKIGVFRPFPDAELREALKGAKKVLVIDRFNSSGSHGVAYTEVRSALYGERPVISSFIVGDEDLFHDDVRAMLDCALDRNGEFEEWFGVELDREAYVVSHGGGKKKLARRGDVTPSGARVVDNYLAPGTSACQGCAPLLVVRQALEAMGEDTVCIYATGCMQAVTSLYPSTAWKIPTAHYLFNNAASAASGVEIAFKRQGRKQNVLVLGGDGGLADIGLQALSGAVERGHDIVYICYDNEAYMNTGVQRSSTTSLFAGTKTTPWGKREKGKDIARIVEAHGCYVATALPSFPGDLMRKVRKGREIKGPAFIHVLSPCPTGWLFDESLSIKICRLAFETSAYVLYEYENGKRIISKRPKDRKPIIEYLKLQGRFSHLTDVEVAELQKEVDRRYFELAGEWPDEGAHTG